MRCKLIQLSSLDLSDPPAALESQLNRIPGFRACYLNYLESGHLIIAVVDSGHPFYYSQE